MEETRERKRRGPLVALLLAAVCLVSVLVTLALLQDDTQQAENTFVVGKIGTMELKEHGVTSTGAGHYAINDTVVLPSMGEDGEWDGDPSTDDTQDDVYGNDYVLYSGVDVPKDPWVTVGGLTTPAYIFVEVVDGFIADTDGNKAVTYEVDSANWTAMKGLYGVNGGQIYLYKGAVFDPNAENAVLPTEVPILAKNANGYEITVAQTDNKDLLEGSVTFYGYMCQKTGFSNATEAYEKCFGPSKPPADSTYIRYAVNYVTDPTAGAVPNTLVYSEEEEYRTTAAFHSVTPAGMVFGGWSLTKDGGIADYQPRDAIVLTKDNPETTLYAIYETAPDNMLLDGGAVATALRADGSTAYDAINETVTSVSILTEAKAAPLIAGLEGTPIDANRSGGIMVYHTSAGQPGDKVYIVSKTDKIYLNTTTSNIFAGLSKCTSIEGLDMLDSSKTKNLSYMFFNCKSLASVDISSLVSSHVGDFSYMFANCSSLTELDVSTLDTSSATNMGYMFAGCSGLTSLDVSKFDTSDVTTMIGTFYGCSGLTSLDVSKFDTSNVTTIHGMFRDCSGLTSLDVSKFNTSNVESMNSVFYGCSGLTSLHVSKFDTSNVTTMRDMFRSCSGLTSLDLSTFDTSNVVNMYAMFRNCSGLTSLDLSAFDTVKVTEMGYMFWTCRNLVTVWVSPYDEVASTGWNASNAKGSTASLFRETPKLVGGNGKTFNTSHTSASYARIDTADTPGYFTDIAHKA